MKESQIQRAIMDYPAARHVLAFRMNTGAMVGEYKGKATFMRYGTVGMADILTFPKNKYSDGDHDAWTLSLPYWIEVKTAIGKQSEFQKSFQKQVEEYGHKYLLARSVDDVVEALSKMEGY